MVYERLKQYLDKHSVNKAALARDVGMSKQLMNSKLNGSCRISVEEYMAICRSLGVPLETFAEEEMC
jgi:transcriptional regulator with XRE-family HTH domain